MYFMEWPAPPSGVLESPGVFIGGMGMDISVLGVDLGKNVLSGSMGQARSLCGVK
jgi:hypothetical protein